MASVPLMSAQDLEYDEVFYHCGLIRLCRRLGHSPFLEWRSLGGVWNSVGSWWLATPVQVVRGVPRDFADHTSYHHFWHWLSETYPGVR